MKRYCLSYKNDNKFLGMEITDAVNDTVFCEGDTVVVCKKCNAIMHESRCYTFSLSDYSA